VSDWFHRRGALARDGWEVVVDGTLPGWAHTGLRVGTLHPDRALSVAPGDVERIILPLEGDATVTAGGERFALHGRPSVFAGPADALYVGTGTGASIGGTGRVAIAEAPVPPGTPPLPTQVIRAADVPVEHRGGGAASRIVRNFGLPGALDARKLLVCEVITPAGSWSGVPPHKHDEAVAAEGGAPGETRLEEIYLFDVAVAEGLSGAAAAATAGTDPIAVFAAYDSPGHEIDLVELVRPGDVALIPYGYHGPAGAMPGYDLYYLNVMAGPDEGRAWRITDDPAHAWIRDTWTGAPE
jgi:5-deoxy-glucuronate isomerase